MLELRFAKTIDLVCSVDVGVEDVIREIRRVLSRGGIEETVVVSRDGVTVTANYSLFRALEWLGVAYVPISVDSAEAAFVPLEALGSFDNIEPSKYRVFRDTEELLYRNWPTPLVRLKNLSVAGREVWAKLEWYNPWSASVKDRIGWLMFRKTVEKLGRVPEKVFEATSTNTGLAIASMCSIYGSKLRAYLPSTAATGEPLLKIFGAEVLVSPKPLTVDLIDEVKRDAATEEAVNLNQFENDANLEVHKVYRQGARAPSERGQYISEGYLRGLGTSGHISAIALYFKSRFRGVRVFGVVPKPGTSIRGLRRVETGMKWVHYVELDGVVEVSPDDAAKSVIEVVRRDGIFIGLSSGAVYYAYKAMAERGELEEGDYVLVFPDSGFKYVDYLARYA